ncbi:trans-aconitate 2-methyltransferase [Devosia sp. YR412]|nr:trans-aconitate 2-methyltransferase [Devosia sp. YR412]
MTSPTWSPTQYLKFEDERTRPARDLIAAVPTTMVDHASDLGCGPGNSTELVLERYPTASVVGVDNSAKMLEKAHQRLPALQFENADVETWVAAVPQDLIFANAVLQWLPDHGALFPRLVGMLAPGGSLAIQMPDNLDEPSHSSMREIASDARWRELMGAASGSRTEIMTAGDYYRMLKPSCQRVDVWRTTYHHPLASPRAVVEWFEGSGLRPYLDALPTAQHTDFLGAYEEQIKSNYPTAQDGSVLLAFPRIFIVATR